MNYPSSSDPAARDSAASHAGAEAARLPDPSGGEAASARAPVEARNGHHAPAGVLQLNCPNCNHPLNLMREHLGIEGHCVECAAPLVAVEEPGTGNVVVRSSAKPAVSESPGAPPSQTPLPGTQTLPIDDSPATSPAPSSQETPATGRPEQHPDRNPIPAFSQPIPVETEPVVNPAAPDTPGSTDIAAAMAGFTGSSSRSRDTSPVKPPPSTTGIPFPAVTPPAAGAPAQDAEAKPPFSPFAPSENGATGNPGNLSIPPSGVPAPESDPPENWETGEKDKPLTRSFASFFKKSSDSGTSGDDAGAATPQLEPEKAPPVSEENRGTLPWESQSNSAALPGEPTFPPEANLRESSPLPGAEKNPNETPEPEAFASKTENWAGTTAAPGAGDDGGKRTGKEKGKKKPNDQFVPGAALSDPGTRRRKFGQPRRGFVRVLVKTVVIFLLFTAVFGGVFFFTPEKQMEHWKGKCIEFLKPGVVLREYLPFEVPFLERLAEEEEAKSANNSPSGISDTSRQGPPPLPSVKITDGPNPQAAAISTIPPRPPQPRYDGAGPGLETVGQLTVELLYRGQSIDERAKVLVDPVGSLPDMWAFYQRYRNLPTLKSIAYRGPVRDAASGRWFGVFDVRENENEEVHRWSVMFTPSGVSKVDWNLYQQLKDKSLTRFLTDPAAPPKDFRLLVRRGSSADPIKNPWESPGIELLLQVPLDNGLPKRITLRQSDFVRLGLDTELSGDHSKIARLQLTWTDSENEPARRVPVVSKVYGWGAW